MSLHTKAHLPAALGTPPSRSCPNLPAPPQRDALCRRSSDIRGNGSAAIKTGPSVAAFNGWQLAIDDDYDHGFRVVMPVHVTAQAYPAAGGMGHESPRDWAPIGSAARAAAHPSTTTSSSSGPADLVIISGDFNNPVRWDKPTAGQVRRLSWTSWKHAGLSVPTTTPAAANVGSQTRHCGGPETPTSPTTSTTHSCPARSRPDRHSRCST